MARRTRIGGNMKPSIYDMTEQAIEQAYWTGRSTGARMAGARVTGVKLPVVRQVRQNTISPLNGAKIQTPFRTPFGNGVPANLRISGYNGRIPEVFRRGGGMIRIGVRGRMGER